MNFYLNNYYITINNNDNNSIYVNINNTFTFQKYETHFIKKDICSFMDINEMFNFMIKCFNKIDNYNVEITMDNSKLTLFFNATIDNFLNISHKMFINKSKSTYMHSMITPPNINLVSPINKLKSENDDLKSQNVELKSEINKLKSEIDNIKSEIDNIKSENIILYYDVSAKPNIFIHENKYIEKLDLSKYNNSKILWFNLNRFSKLNELIINSSTIAHTNLVTKTIFQLCRFYIHDCPYFDTFNLPHIKKLEIRKGNFTNTYSELGCLENLPNLEELRLTDFLYRINILTYIQAIPKLNKLILTNCPYVNSKVDVRDYCLKNNIQYINSSDDINY